MTFLTAQEARTLADINAHHHGTRVEENLVNVLGCVRKAATAGHREIEIDHLKAENELSELLGALQTLGFLAKSIRQKDNSYILNVCW